MASASPKDPASVFASSKSFSTVEAVYEGVSDHHRHGAKHSSVDHVPDANASAQHAGQSHADEPAIPHDPSIKWPRCEAGLAAVPKSNILPDDWGKSQSRRIVGRESSFPHTSTLSIGDVQRELPNAREQKKGALSKLVRYKGPISKKNVMQQATVNAELQVAVEAGDANRVAGLLRYGFEKRSVDVNAPLYPRRESLLHLAARKNQRDICIMLLDAKADLQSDEITEGRHPMHDACGHGSFDVVELFLDRRAHVEESTFGGLRPLHFAASSGSADVADLLLDRRASVNATTGSQMQPLHLASRAGHTEAVRLFCRRGAKVDMEASGKRPLHYACLGGHFGAAAALLDAQALGVSGDFHERGLLVKYRHTRIEQLARAVDQLQFLRDEAEEMADMGNAEEAASAFRDVVADYEALGLVDSALRVRRDAERYGFNPDRAAD